MLPPRLLVFVGEHFGLPASGAAPTLQVLVHPPEVHDVDLS
jgi:hypothetical protein